MMTETGGNSSLSEESLQAERWADKFSERNSTAAGMKQLCAGWG